VHLLNNKRINVENLLYSTNSYARIGIDLDDGFTALESGEKVFTYNYAFSGNHYSNAGKTFFSNKTNETVVYKSYNGQYEACIKTTTAAQLPKAYWKWGGSEDDQTYDPLVKVPYTGNPYVITNTSGKIARVGIDTQVDSFSATEVGKYAFYSSSVNISNQVFTFEILPVEVDIKWNNNDFIYNGGLHKPTAYIEEDPNCKVTVIGEKIESGSGYVATAIELSNKNYKINPASMNCYYSIAKAVLNKPVGNEAFEYTGLEQTYKPEGYEERTMAITGNSATEVGKYSAVISLKDKKNYVWADGTNGDITIEYAITGVPVVEEGEYKFIYEDENGKRKTYAEGGYVHGVNDSTLNKGKAILGNIAPYTSVNEFVQKLGYNPSRLTIYNSNDYKIYENGSAASGVDSSVLDKKYELAVGTGWYIDYTLDNGTSERIYLSVLGDISGDGRVNSVDITNIRGLIGNSENYNNLTEAQKLASLVDNKGTISVVDIEILKAYINGDIDLRNYY
ncbi:MAG: dockerin type I repeat-containing protein, partial [Clostridia bacterium]|nr:dockerin type I repeat-containing protein [Clostridia bacterium]